MSPIKLLCLNIEGKRHLERIVPFLRNNHFDVVMLNEVFEDDIPLFSDLLATNYIFAPALTKSGVRWGNLALCMLPDHKYSKTYYVGSEESIKEYDHSVPFDQCKSFVGIEFTADNRDYRLLSTHFTWSPKGEPSDLQREELRYLYGKLDELPHFVISGDFNTPRGTEIFDNLASKYKDNIPPEVTTTIDGNFHKAGHLPYVVDGLFSTDDYLIQNVKVIDGLSDHCAVTAEIERSS